MLAHLRRTPLVRLCSELKVFIGVRATTETIVSKLWRMYLDCHASGGVVEQFGDFHLAMTRALPSAAEHAQRRKQERSLRTIASQERRKNERRAAAVALDSTAQEMFATLNSFATAETVNWPPEPDHKRDLGCMTDYYEGSIYRIPSVCAVCARRKPPRNSLSHGDYDEEDEAFGNVVTIQPDERENLLPHFDNLKVNREYFAEQGVHTSAELEHADSVLPYSRALRAGRQSAGAVGKNTSGGTQN